MARNEKGKPKGCVFEPIVAPEKELKYDNKTSGNVQSWEKFELDKSSKVSNIYNQTTPGFKL